MNRGNQIQHRTRPPRVREPVPTFDPRDSLLLEKLIDKTPGVKNVNGDSNVLNELWVQISREYNRQSLKYRTAPILRRKYKQMRDIIKRRMREMIKSDGINKRPRLDGHNNQSFINSVQAPNLTANVNEYFPESGPSGRNVNYGRAGPSQNFGNNYDGDLLSENNTYVPGQLLPNFSPPTSNRFSEDNFANFQQSPIINPQQQSSLKRDYPKDDFDPFLVEDQCSLEDHIEDEDSIRRSDRGQGDSDRAAIVNLQREKLELEIKNRKMEHYKLMNRMQRYHEMKMKEMSLSMRNMKEKHSLEVIYLKLKIKQCKEAIASGSGDTSNPLEDISSKADDFLVFQALGMVKPPLNTTAEMVEPSSTVSKENLDSEMDLFLESTGLKLTEDKERNEDAACEIYKNRNSEMDNN